jgi:hypothetical protein
MAHVSIDYVSLKELDGIESVVIKGMNDNSYPKREESLKQLLAEENDVDDEPRTSALLEYSVEHWPSSFINLIIGIESAVPDKVYGLYQVENIRCDLWFPKLWRAHASDRLPANVSSIVLTAFDDHHIVLCKVLGEATTDLQKKDYGGNTALIWVVRLDYIEIVRLLLEKRAAINAQGGYVAMQSRQLQLEATSP